MAEVKRECPVDPLIEWVRAEWREFESSWRPSSRNPNNITRKRRGLVLTIFFRDGLYGWSVNGGDGPRFSEQAFASQAEALENLGAELHIGDV